MATVIGKYVDLTNRAIKNVKPGTSFGGIQDDSYATELQFSYSDPTILDSDGQGYRAYIAFDVRDEEGTPLVFGPGSTPVFDGYAFSVPWSVTSRTKNGRAQYQLILAKSDFETDDRGIVHIVDDPTIIRMAMDGFVLKPAVRDKCPRPGKCAPVLSEPSVYTLLDMFSDQAVVGIQQYIDTELDRLSLMVRTYTGKYDCRIALAVPYLTEAGKIATQFYDYLTKWTDDEGGSLATDDNVPSAKLVKDSLDAKLDDSQIVSEWSEETSDGRIPSEKLTKDSLDKKVDDEQLVTAWSNPLSDSNIPSEKLVKETLDTKTDKTMAIPAWDSAESYPLYATVVYEGAIYISSHVEDGVNAGHVPGEGDYWWSTVRGGSGSIDGEGRFVAVIGNGTDTVIDVEHGLGTYDLFTTIRTNDSDRRYVETKMTAVSDTTLRLEFTEPPAENGMVVVIAKGDRTDCVYNGVIGNGVDTEYVITHNLGTTDFVYELKTRDPKSDTPEYGEYILATVSAVSSTQVKIEFSSPPAVDGIRVMLAPIVSKDWEGRWVHHQEDPMDIWTIRHDLHRLVTVQAFTDDGTEVEGQVVQDLTKYDRVTIYFSEPVSGIAILQ